MQHDATVKPTLEDGVTGMRARGATTRTSSRVVAPITHGVALATACLVSYEVTVNGLRDVYSVSESDDLLGGLWAAIAAAFVYRCGYEEDLAAARSRIRATALSFILCLAYLVVLPFHPWGMALLIGISAVLLIFVGLGDDVVTAAVTIAVVMVAGALDPHDAWRQPILRFVDTVVGVVVGLAAAYIASRVGRRVRRDSRAALNR